MAPDEPPTVEIEELERRMRPGSFSTVGFIGPHERLADVLATDASTLAAMGLTREALASPLDRLLDAAEQGSGRSAVVDGRFDARVEVFTGFQICPFAVRPHSSQCTEGGGVRHASIDWSVSNRRTRETLRGPGLIVHLIRAHGFFEGVESPHRVDPRALARVLELDTA